MNLNRKLSSAKHGPPRQGKKQKAKKRTRERRKANAAAGLRRKCPPSCTCICHDTGGGWHDHVGQPCPGKKL